MHTEFHEHFLPQYSLCICVGDAPPKAAPEATSAPPEAQKEAPPPTVQAPPTPAPAAVGPVPTTPPPIQPLPSGPMSSTPTSSVKPVAAVPPVVEGSGVSVGTRAETRVSNFSQAFIQPSFNG